MITDMKTKICLLNICLLVAALFSACTQNRKVDSSLERFPAQSFDTISKDQPLLVYVTYDKQGKAIREEITSGRWKGDKGAFSAGGREDYLLKMFYASTVGTSSRGILHSVCFSGNAVDIENNYFHNNPAVIRNVAADVQTKTSSDGRMIGIKFQHKVKGELFFRVANCSAGKSTVSDVAVPLAPVVAAPAPGASAPGTRAPVPPTGGAAPSKGDAPVVAARDPLFGFSIFHKVKNLDKKKYPEFVVRADYNDAPIKDEEKPWKGLDLKDPKQSLKFLLLVQKYFYQNMANQNPSNPDFNFIADKNKDRFWCHMPWMHVGTAGREALHGLTQERDLVPSTQIPAYMKSTPGTNWGVAYFNSTACKGIQDVFGTISAPKDVPDFHRENYFADGALITKMLFTTANFPEIAGAYSWNAHVNEVGSTERAIKSVRHIQMDIAVKDSTLVGTNPILKNWAMAGLYYDPTYDYDKEYKAFLDGMENPIASIPNLPKELLKMRPMGVQTGFDNPTTLETIVFQGSSTNGLKGRLNGPADNPKTSCLGCHAAAGTEAKMVPGFLSMKMFEPFANTPALDFSQQLALAKANYETSIP